MLAFDGTNRDELGKWLFYSHIQDAMVKSFELVKKRDVLHISAFHPVFDESVILLLTGARVIFSSGGQNREKREVILSATIIQTLPLRFNEKDFEIDAGILLMFEMTSGRMILVAAEKAYVDTGKHTEKRGTTCLCKLMKHNCQWKERRKSKKRKKDEE